MPLAERPVSQTVAPFCLRRVERSSCRTAPVVTQRNVPARERRDEPGWKVIFVAIVRQEGRNARSEEMVSMVNAFRRRARSRRKKQSRNRFASPRIRMTLKGSLSEISSLIYPKCLQSEYLCQKVPLCMEANPSSTRVPACICPMRQSISLAVPHWQEPIHKATVHLLLPP